MSAQSTLISYHTEAFVKTEIAWTVQSKTHESKLQSLESYNALQICSHAIELQRYFQAWYITLFLFKELKKYQPK